MESLLSLACLLSVVTTSNGGGDLRFSFITAKTGAFTSFGALPLVDFALELINQNDSILSNYTLNYTTILDDECHEISSLSAFFQHFQNSSQPTYLSTMCCGCSTSTIPVADISFYWNIPQISYAASATVLNDHQRFPGFFRTLQSQENFAAALVKVVDYFGWTQMVVVTQDESLFRLVTDNLITSFNAMGWKLQFYIVSSDLNASVFPYDAIFNWEEDYRIIFVNAYQPYILNVFCEAYYRGLFGPKYVYITRGFASNGWWATSTNSSCQSEVIEHVLNKSIVIVPTGELSTGELPTGISGLTPDEVHDEYLKRLSWPKYEGLSEAILADYAFDAVWALGLALDKTSEMVMSKNETGCEHVSGELVALEDFDYTNRKMGCLLVQGFSQVSFIGASGEVYFESTGGRFDNVLEINQYRRNDQGQFYRHPFALVTVYNSSNSSFQYRDDENNDTVFSNGVPYDGAVVTAIHLNSVVIVIIYSILATMGLVYSAVCFTFTIIFRSKKVVKLASPNLNYLLIVGATLQYIAIYFTLFTVATSDLTGVQTLLCNVHNWTYSIGYSTSFAVILAKTWRIYYIFNKPLPKPKVFLYSDGMLFIIVGVIVGVEIIILLIGTAVPQSRLNAILVADVEHPPFVNEDGINIEYYQFICNNTSSVVWLAISFVYKALLQILAMFMAFHTRKVKIKGLNDTKEIFALVYLNSIILVLLAVAEFALHNYHDVHSGLLSLAHLFGATLFLSLVIVPRMINLYRDPNGNNVMASSKENGSDKTTKNEYTEMFTSLQKRITELEEMLKMVSDAECTKTESVSSSTCEK